MREIVEEPTARAGVMRWRVLSLLDRLHRERAVSFDQYAAGTMLRNDIMRQAAPSEGVGSYGQSIGHADGTTKADRVGQRLTGFRVDYEGRVYWRGGRQANEEQRKLEDALFAACGLHDEAGGRRVNAQQAGLLIRIVLETEPRPTLTEVAQQLGSHYPAQSQRSTA